MCTERHIHLRTVTKYPFVHRGKTLARNFINAITVLAEASVDAGLPADRLRISIRPISHDQRIPRRHREAREDAAAGACSDRHPGIRSRPPWRLAPPPDAPRRRAAGRRQDDDRDAVSVGRRKARREGALCLPVGNRRRTDRVGGQPRLVPGRHRPVRAGAARSPYRAAADRAAPLGGRAGRNRKAHHRPHRKDQPEPGGHRLARRVASPRLRAASLPPADPRAEAVPPGQGMHDAAARRSHGRGCRRQGPAQHRARRDLAGAA